MSAVITVEPVSRPLPPRGRRPVVLGSVLLVAACVAIVAFAVGRLWTESPPAFVDLDVYRKGVRAWWHGKDLYGALPVTIANDRLPFVYPPFAVLFLGPLAVLPWPVAAALMLALSVAALAVVVHLSVRHVWPTASRPVVVAVTAVLVSAALLLEPVWDTLWFGQVNLLLMALVALDCLVEHPRWPRGALIGVAAAVKLTPAVFLLYLLLRRDFRAAAVAAVTAAVATAAGFLVSWHGSLEFWFGRNGGARSISGSSYYTNQTVDGYLARLGLAHPIRGVVWLVIVGAVLVVAVVAIRRAHRIGDSVLAMSATGCFGLIASPTSWGHHWTYAVPAVIALAAHAIRDRSGGWSVACAITAVVFVVGPYRLVPSDRLAYLHWSWWQQVVGNSYVLLGVTLLAVFGLSRGRATAGRSR